MSRKSFRIGVVFDNVQPMDMIGADCFFSASKDMCDEMESMELPKELTDSAAAIEWHWIASTMEPTRTMPSLKIQPTTTFDKAPRDYDVLLVGGPSPSFRPEAATKFFRETIGKGRVKTVLTTCVGSIWVADSGVLDGKTVTTNREALPLARKMHPKVTWLDQRWVIDGNIWTSGAAGAGIDMVATYVVQNFPPAPANFMLAVLDLDPVARGQFYPAGSKALWELVPKK